MVLASSGFAESDRRTVEPAGRDEADPDAWAWFTAADLEARADELAADVGDLGARAIEALS